MDNDELKWYMAIYPKAWEYDVRLQFCLKELPLNIKEISYYFEIDIPELNDRKYRGFGCFCCDNLKRSNDRMTFEELKNSDHLTMTLKLRIMTILYQDNVEKGVATDDDMINID